jgi:lactoylglutathione lyase
MKPLFKSAAPYAADQMNLPVRDLEAAIPFYETIMGFQVVSRKNSPHRSAALRRDGIQIGLAENGGDPTQEGCFFEVDKAEAAFAELKSKGLEKEEAGFRLD